MHPNQHIYHHSTYFTNVEREYDIKVTIIIGSGGEFSATFDSATKAFLAVYDYLRSDIRDCYYTRRPDELMELILHIRKGIVNTNECSMFKLEAIKE
jgi:hypothetical protein